MRKMWLPLFSLVLVVAFAAPVLAQETDPTAANRANIYLFVEYIRNRNLPELLPLVNSPDFVLYNPLSPDGSLSDPQAAIPGEIEMNNAFDLDFTDYIILAEGNYTGLIGYQEADFTGEWYSTPPNGQHYGGQILLATEFDERGLEISDIETWNSIQFNQFMGWMPRQYTFDSKPWNIRLGVTTTLPAQHHATLQAMWDALRDGRSAADAAAYAPTVITHDFLRNWTGSAAAVAQYNELAALPGFEVKDTRIICEGDLCLSAAVTAVNALDPADEDGRASILWSAVHRFVDGQIAEEWWMYDNAALWSFVTPHRPAARHPSGLQPTRLSAP